MGAFQTDNDGDGGFTVTRRVVFFEPYNLIVVTAEEKNDEDPSKQGPEVLRGNMDD